MLLKKIFTFLAILIYQTISFAQETDTANIIIPDTSVNDIEFTLDTPLVPVIENPDIINENNLSTPAPAIDTLDKTDVSDELIPEKVESTEQPADTSVKVEETIEKAEIPIDSVPENEPASTFEQPADTSLKIESNGVISPSEIPENSVPDTIVAPASENASSVPETTPDTLLKIENAENQAIGASTENLPDTSLVTLKDTLVLNFTKYKIGVEEERRIFNVIAIRNYFSEPIDGIFQISIPENWRLLTTELNQNVHIEPNDEAIIPITLIVPSNVSGGKAFPVNAKFTDSNNRKYMAGCYIYSSVKSEFSISADKNQIYFNSITATASFKLKLSNKGNIPELIKVNFKMGKLITVQGLKNDSDFIYVELPENRDTVLHYTASYRKPSADEKFLESRISETYLNISAVSGEIKKVTSIWFKNIPFLYYNNIAAMQGTPLTIGVFFNNMLTNSPLSMNLIAGGELLLKNNSNLNYFLNIFNWQFSNEYYRGLSFEQFYTRHLRFGVGYLINKNNNKIIINAGDRLINRFGGVSGRGLSVNYLLNNHEIFASVAKNFLNPIFGATIGYSGKIGLLPRFSVGTSFIQNNSSNIYSQTVLFQSSFPSFFKQNFNYSLTYRINTPQANSPFSPSQGLRYRFSLGSNFTKLNYSISYGNNTQNFFYTNSFISMATANAQYKINNISKIDFIANHTKNTVGNFSELNTNFTAYKLQTARIFYNGRFNPMLSYQIGPYIEINERINNLTNLKYTKNISSHSERINIGLNKRINSRQSVSPFIRTGYSTITMENHYYIPDTFFTIKSRPLFNLNTGFTYNYNQIFTLNVSYFYGPFFFWNQIDAINYGVYSKSIRIMPVIRKTYFTKTASINLFTTANYILNMPQNNEQISLNFLGDFGFENGWSVNLNFNAYFSSRYVPEDRNKLSFRNYNLGFGVRKTFNIQQPRIKYYDFKAVFFKDLNGNGAREENEPLLNNILVQIDRVQMENMQGYFVQTELMSNVNGEVHYKNIPEGDYMLQITPLINLVDIYCQNGNKQQISISQQNMTYYIPFVQSYSVSGKIILERDEFSSSGAIDISNIRITATSLKGDNYYTLTGKDGHYIINIPQSGFYKVKVNNVIGDNFEVENEEFLLDFNGLKSYELDFKFTEKKRKINFNGNKDFNFKFENGRKSEEKDTSKATPAKLLSDTAKGKTGSAPQTPPDKNKTEKTEGSAPIDKSQIKFKVQIGAYNTDVPNDIVEKIRALPDVQESRTEEGLMRYTAGEFSDYASAEMMRQELLSKGIATDTTFVVIIADYKGRIFSADEAKELLKD